MSGSLTSPHRSVCAVTREKSNLTAVSAGPDSDLTDSPHAPSVRSESAHHQVRGRYPRPRRGQRCPAASLPTCTRRTGTPALPARHSPGIGRAEQHPAAAGKHLSDHHGRPVVHRCGHHARGIPRSSSAPRTAPRNPRRKITSRHQGCRVPGRAIINAVVYLFHHTFPCLGKLNIERRFSTPWFSTGQSRWSDTARKTDNPTRSHYSSPSYRLHGPETS